MTKYIKAVLIFLSGALSYQIALIVFTGSIEFGNPNEKDRGYGMSTDYFKSELKEVCDHLEENNCRCEPVVRTSESCRPILSEFVGNKYRSSFLEEKGSNWVPKSEN